MGFAVGSVLCIGAAGGSDGAELESVAVEDSFRRRGVGRLLCNEVIAWSGHQGASHIDLEVRAESSGAIALYRSLGFVALGRRPRYYQSPDEDALMMRLALHHSPAQGIVTNQTCL